MSVAAGSGASTTLYVKNSGTGAASLDVESALTTGGTVTFVGATVRWTAPVSVSANFGGSVSGLQLSPPVGTVYVSDPAPPARASGI